MPSSTMPNNHARTGAIIAAVSLGLLGALAAPTAASAHTGTLSVTASCASDGSRVVAYAGSTSNVPDSGIGHTAELTVTEVAPAAAVISPSSQTVTGDTDYTFTETMPGDATSASATASLEWGDGAASDPNGEIDFTDSCRTTPPASATDASASVAVSSATCKEKGSAKFTIVDATWNDRNDTRDGARTATANSGHRFSSGSTTETVHYKIAPKTASNDSTCAIASIHHPKELAKTGVDGNTVYVGLAALLIILAGAACLLIARKRPSNRRT